RRRLRRRSRGQARRPQPLRARIRAPPSARRWPAAEHRGHRPRRAAGQARWRPDSRALRADRLGARRMSLRLHGDTPARPGMRAFAVNVGRAPRPPALEQALQRALATSDRYPNEQAAREATAARHGRRVEEVLLLNGASEAFWLLAHAYRPSL